MIFQVNPFSLRIQRLRFIQCFWFKYLWHRMVEFKENCCVTMQGLYFVLLNIPELSSGNVLMTTMSLPRDDKITCTKLTPPSYLSSLSPDGVPFSLLYLPFYRFTALGICTTLYPLSSNTKWRRVNNFVLIYFLCQLLTICIK